MMTNYMSLHKPVKESNTLIIQRYPFVHIYLLEAMMSLLLNGLGSHPLQNFCVFLPAFATKISQ